MIIACFEVFSLKNLHLFSLWHNPRETIPCNANQQGKTGKLQQQRPCEKDVFHI